MSGKSQNCSNDSTLPGM